MNNSTEIGDGPYEDYFYNGTLKSQGEYKNGKKNGVFKYYDEWNGKIWKIETYENNLLHGKFETFLGISESGYYNNGQKEGVFELYKNNKLTNSFTYENGIKSGEFINYHNNGEVQSKGFLKKGIIDGKYELFDENGNSIERGVYIDEDRIAIIDLFEEKEEILEGKAIKIDGTFYLLENIDFINIFHLYNELSSVIYGYSIEYNSIKLHKVNQNYQIEDSIVTLQDLKNYVKQLIFYSKKIGIESSDIIKGKMEIDSESLLSSKLAIEICKSIIKNFYSIRGVTGNKSLYEIDLLYLELEEIVNGFA